jgi:ribosomal protein L12E/L44/L45/RPP1/RPP2
MSYYNKYLKYKLKYLNIKNKNKESTMFSIYETSEENLSEYLKGGDDKKAVEAVRAVEDGEEIKMEDGEEEEEEEEEEKDEKGEGKYEGGIN